MSAEQPSNESEINEEKQAEDTNKESGGSGSALAQNGEASKSGHQVLKDIAIPGPSNGESKLRVEQSSSTSTDQKSRKRERCDDDTSNSDEDDDKKVESNEAPAEDRPNDNETCPFPRLRIRTRHRRYRRRLNDRSSSSSSSSSGTSSSSGSKNSLSSSDDERPHDATSSSNPVSHPDDSDSSADSLLGDRILQVLTNQARARRLALDSDDTWSLMDSDDSEGDSRVRNTEIGKVKINEEKYPKCLSKEIPKHKWSVTKAILNRQIGMNTKHQEPQLFSQRCYGSLHCVKRLELMYKLDKHHGCVNAISFNQSGTRLASGSDDKKIIVWDWAIGQSLLSYSSGHTNNVFQCKFLPMTGDNHIVSSARDGQVRLAVLSSTGECRGTRRLAHHRRPVNKLSLLPETPHVFLSAGEDGKVMAIDVRNSKQSTLVTVRNNRSKVGLYSVDSHPLNSEEFCVCGKDYYIRIYDKRKIDVNGAPMKRFCPSHIVGTDKYTNVTCALYNHDGTEILGSYNDESLYLFDTRHSDGADFVHKYEGHRNSATVKSCDFFGPKSEYIMSGSDCGHIFFWDKNTEAIVQFMRGDESGVVNALVGHPQFPILATSGLDSDVKIWVPSCEEDPEMKELKKTVAQNLQDRMDEQPYRVDVFETDLNFGFPSRFRASVTHSTPRSSSSDGSDSDGNSPRIQCPQS
ncbi:DDB1- and CUL4-associated factor 8-like isoform X2 [Thrips palmi]|uniref:DDB1- and CUL4-associated factor 8-like isoform X2 n=1 Tax=Thrips palmi TaxID=161013 RepID=A0A6P8YWU0_THRPL|nr:DDB1- and CUL4-associated factor 8-like isoform X2 [Thrips palmi]